MTTGLVHEQPGVLGESYQIVDSCNISISIIEDG